MAVAYATSDASPNTPPLRAGLKANQCNFLECEAVQALKALEPTKPTS